MMKYLAVLFHPRIYLLGRKEADGGIGMTYGHPETARSIAYDIGRNHGERGL